jgi:hypothetical protein
MRFGNLWRFSSASVVPDVNTPGMVERLTRLARF